MGHRPVPSTFKTKKKRNFGSCPNLFCTYLALHIQHILSLTFPLGQTQDINHVLCSPTTPWLIPGIPPSSYLSATLDSFDFAFYFLYFAHTTRHCGGLCCLFFFRPLGCRRRRQKDTAHNSWDLVCYPLLREEKLFQLQFSAMTMDDFDDGTRGTRWLVEVRGKGWIASPLQTKEDFGMASWQASGKGQGGKSHRTFTRQMERPVHNQDLHHHHLHSLSGLCLE